MGIQPRIGLSTLVRSVVITTLLAMSGLALANASWLGLPYSLSIPTHITGIGQSISGQVNLTLQHDEPCNLTVSTSMAGNEVLKSGSNTLTTYYRLTGIPGGDATWVASSDFITHNYSVPGSDPALPITLWVEGTASPTQAPEAGAYSASVVLTVTW